MRHQEEVLDNNMDKKLYVIYDLVSKSVFSPVMLADNDTLIIRDIKTADLGSIIESNLQDFDLYCIGTLDTNKGVIKDTEKVFVCHLEGVKVNGKKQR